jgi:DnaJ-domain-containing protein 1
MAGQFHAGHVSRSTRQESRDVLPAFEPNWSGQSCQFVDDFQRLMGDDFEPDPLFFVDCWTIGTSAAASNFQQRRQEPADRELPSPAFLDLFSSSDPLLLQQDELLSVASAAANARRCYGDWRRQPSEEPAARAQDQNPQPGETSAEPLHSRQETIRPMTLKSARRLLGVTAISSRKEIKTAYRKMASQWHPDRLGFRTESVRQIATEQMAAINEAYHLLRSCLPQGPVGFGPD